MDASTAALGESREDPVPSAPLAPAAPVPEPTPPPGVAGKKDRSHAAETVVRYLTPYYKDSRFTSKVLRHFYFLSC